MSQEVEFMENINDSMVVKHHAVSREPGMVRLLMKMGVVDKSSTGYTVLMTIMIVCFVASILYYIIGTGAATKKIDPKTIPHNVNQANTLPQR